MTRFARPQRQTKYCRAITRTLETLGHATNAELLQRLRETYPDVSATTVHRATARLAARGAIAVAPPGINGSMRYDANTTPHDHFMCGQCGMLRDTDVKGAVVPILEASIGDDCHIAGRINVCGICETCQNNHPD